MGAAPHMHAIAAVTGKVFASMGHDLGSDCVEKSSSVLVKLQSFVS